MTATTPPRAIDYHAHVMIPEVYAVTARHSLISLPLDGAAPQTEEVRRLNADPAVDGILCQLGQAGTVRADHPQPVGLGLLFEPHEHDVLPIAGPRDAAGKRAS